MTDEWVRDLADKRAIPYAKMHTVGEGKCLKGDVIVENQMSYSDGFVDGWAMAQEYLRRICVDVGGYEGTGFYGLFTNQSNFKGVEDAFPKTTQLIKQLEL